MESHGNKHWKGDEESIIPTEPQPDMPDMTKQTEEERALTSIIEKMRYNFNTEFSADSEATNKYFQRALLTSAFTCRRPFFQMIFEKCKDILSESKEWNSYDRAFNLTVEIIENFLRLRVKTEAEQLVQWLEKTADIIKNEPTRDHEQIMLPKSKGFRYRLEFLRLSKRSSGIPICGSGLRRAREQKMKSLFEEFLENEDKSHSSPWTGTDHSLVSDFIAFIREEVGRKCEQCATCPDNFVNYFLHRREPFNNLLVLSINFLLKSAGFNPNKEIDEFGNTVLHIIIKRSKLAPHRSAVPVAQLLIENGFYFNRTNNEGETVLELVQNFPDSALFHYLNKIMNPSASI
jgi:hypothetical protein